PDHKSLLRLSNRHSACGTAFVPSSAVSSLGGFRTPAPCAPPHRHGAGIRNPSQKATSAGDEIKSALPPRTEVGTFLRAQNRLGRRVATILSDVPLFMSISSYSGSALEPFLRVPSWLMGPMKDHCHEVSRCDCD